MISSIMGNIPLARFAYRMMRWHARYTLFRSVTPLACGVYITSACNFRCDFCNIHRIRPPFTLPEDTAHSLAEQLGRLGLVYFSISGGEPLLVPYTFDVLAHAKRAGVLYTHVVSNGYLMDAGRAAALGQAGVSEISFSIDGPAEAHDKARGMPGAFDRVLEAVAHVKTHAPRTRVVLNAILKPCTPEDALHAVEVARNLGVDIKVQPENEHPDFGAETAGHQAMRGLDGATRSRLVDAVQRLMRMKHVVNSRAFLDNYLNFILDPEHLALRKADCLFGYHHFECFNGEIMPCLEGQDWQGGTPIDDLDLAAHLASPAYRQRVEGLRRCEGCLRNYYVCYYEPRLNFPLWNYASTRRRLYGRHGKDSDS